MPIRRVVAVFNTSPDTVDMLRGVLEEAGFVVVTAFTYDLRDAKVDPEAFMRTHTPAVVVYDIAPPYEQNWRLFQHFRSLPAFRYAKYLLTTTNIERVHEVIGETPVMYEIVGKPFDLARVVDEVKRIIADDSIPPGSISSSSRPS